MTTVINPRLDASGDFGVQLLKQLGLEGKAIRKLVVSIDAHRKVRVIVFEKRKLPVRWNTTISVETGQAILAACAVQNCTRLTIVITSTDLVKIYAQCIGKTPLVNLDWSVFRERVSDGS